jgi:hypothetical protein
MNEAGLSFTAAGGVGIVGSPMADDYARLDPEELAIILARLDQVMDEAARLRREVTRQLAETRGRDQQRLSSARRRKTTKKKPPAT